MTRPVPSAPPGDNDARPEPTATLHPRQYITTEEVMQYLSGGALVDMLSRGSAGDDSRRAWLRRDGEGNVAHTFDAREGQVGGAPVPLHTFKEGHIFKRNVGAVLDYLRTFGLSRVEARQVVQVVGTR
jgi:hypothetical protein